MSSKKLTLYKKLKATETIKEDIKKDVDDFNNFMEKYDALLGMSPTWARKPFKVDVPGTQSCLMKNYEKNPVFKDAIKGKLTVEESLKELAQINKGYKMWLPRSKKKHKVHNQRCKELSELIYVPNNYLEAKGIAFPDNFVSGFGFTTAMGTLATGVVYLLTNLMPEMTSLNQKGILLISASMTGVLGILIGLAGNSIRFEKLKTDQTQYIDNKIKEIYK